MALRFRSMKTGSTLGVLEYQMLDKGKPFPLAAGTGVKFRMVEKDSSPLNVIIDDKDGFIVDGPEGVVGYQRIPDDTALAALMLCEFQVTVPSGRIHKSPDIQLLISPELP